MTTKFLAIATLSLCTLAFAAPSQAQHRGGGSAGRAAGSSGRAVPRASAPAVVAPRGVSPGIRGGYYGRPYYGSRFGFGFYAGYPYYSPYYYPYGYYGYPYAYGPYGYDGGYAVAGQGAQAYGSVRIADAPKDAQVFADGYYVGSVDDFDGTFQHLNLEAGTHHLEIREQGQAPVSFDVNIRPGESITYHAK